MAGKRAMEYWIVARSSSWLPSQPFSAKGEKGGSAKKSFQARFPTRRNSASAGFGLVELIFAFGLMVTVTLVLMNHTTVSYRESKQNGERIFAFTKASAILDEVQSFMNTSEDLAADSLDALDDGVSFNPVLSISEENDAPVDPDHPLSGNTMRDAAWRWARRISVRPLPGVDNRNMRYVTVKIFKKSKRGNYLPIADISRVVNSISSFFPPTQVYDIYLLALENIPGWWVHMASIRPFIEASITDLEARNPGAKFRTHWITKSGYGRNRLYSPFINESTDSVANIPLSYFYPGTMPVGQASASYYVPQLMKARMWKDGTRINDYDAVANPAPYALADNFNNCMRLPAARALFQARVSAGLENPLTPTWRLLLEDMCSKPQKYRNAILINLHGELLPMPALRNYSDAAKSPATVSGSPGLRVVTHSERLRYVKGASVATSEDIKLRCYAWRTDPASPADVFTNGKPITLQIVGLDLTGNVNGQGIGPLTLEIKNLEGGVDRGDGDYTYKPMGLSSTTSTHANGMHYSVSYVDDTGSGGEKYTLIKLLDTPSISPPISGLGLPALSHLYGYEYIPCSTELANDFSSDLASGTVNPNTARWTVRIPKEVMTRAGTGIVLAGDKVLEIRTRIDDDMTSGKLFPTPIDPENVSTTYVYWTGDVEGVPFTERYQYIGDPRHCPYADLKAGGASFPNGYNWYFDDFKDFGFDAQANWPGFDSARLKDGWKGRIEVDYPRLALLLRTALTRSAAIYTTLTGFSYYYIGLGNEIGYDSANGYANSIPVNGRPYGLLTQHYVDSIASGGSMSGRYQKILRAGSGADYWWGRYWLGELYPDNEYAMWLANGNLLAGSLVGEYKRVARASIGVDLPRGTSLANAQRRTQREGSTSFFNIGTQLQTFHHQFASGQKGDLLGAGLELAQNYSFPLPHKTLISRPFRLNTNAAGGVGSEWNFIAEYPRFSASIIKTYYRHQSGSEGSSLVDLTDPSGTKSAFIVVNGLDRTLESGSSFIAKYSMLSLLHSYFESGHPMVVNHHELPPRLLIDAPSEISEIKDPASVDIKWSVSWKRWDGRKYSTSFSDTYSQAESGIDYVLLYSRDGGKTYHYLSDDQLATPGTRPQELEHIRNDAGFGPEIWPWPTPKASFPEGSYLLRIEAYREGEALHYSFHQTKIYIHR